MALLPCMACRKLVRPNTPPKMAPAVGPMVMAPMATGTVSSDAANGPICKYPSGV